MSHSYGHLDLKERRQLYRLRSARVPVRVIAEKMSRDRSTIYREIKRNYWHDPEVPECEGYHPVTADDLAKERRRTRRKLARWPELRDAVIDRLQAGWTPEQIAGRLKRETHVRCRISHEAIYQFIYSREGRAAELYKLLPEQRRKRRLRGARRHHGNRFPEDRRIAHRPKIVAGRRQFGHWEGDLVMFRKRFGKSNVTSLCERKTRLAVLLRNNDRQSTPIMEAMIDRLGALPQDARRSITFDRGTEFTDFELLADGMGTETWFCDPQAPWQKGSVENTNGRVRKDLPRDRDPLTVSQAELDEIMTRHNRTPRKCLGYRTPEEAFRDELGALARRQHRSGEDQDRQATLQYIGSTGCLAILQALPDDQVSNS